MGLRGLRAGSQDDQTRVRALSNRTEGMRPVPDDKTHPCRCEPLVTAARAAELLKLHPKTVKRLAHAGELPAMKIGRVWRFRESSLDAWMSAQLQCLGHPSPEKEKLQ